MIFIPFVDLPKDSFQNNYPTLEFVKGHDWIIKFFIG